MFVIGAVEVASEDMGKLAPSTVDVAETRDTSAIAPVRFDRDSVHEALEATGRYKNIELIGSGGMAYVFAAKETSMLERELALKVPKLWNAEQSIRFRNERYISGEIGTGSHRHLLLVYGAPTLQIPGDPAHLVDTIEMERFEGPNLSGTALNLRVQKFREPEKFRNTLCTTIQDVIIPIARAIDEVHGKGVVHRDIKPGNIIVGPDHTPKLTDFGLSLRFKDLQHLEPVCFKGGTPGFVAPEHIRSPRDLDHRSDIFSLGAVLFDLAAGVTPWGEDEVPYLRNSAPKAPGENDSLVPIQLDGPIMKALAQYPCDRYQTGAKLADALEEALSTVEFEHVQLVDSDLPPAEIPYCPESAITGVG